MPRPIAGARLVVAHAGVGSVVSAGEQGKPIVVLPRRAALGEHTSDHQVETIGWLRGKPGVHVAGTRSRPARLHRRRGGGGRGRRADRGDRGSRLHRPHPPLHRGGLSRRPGQRPAVVQGVDGRARRAGGRPGLRPAEGAGGVPVGELGQPGAGGGGLGQGAAGLGGGERGGEGRLRRRAVAEGELGLAAVELDLGVAGQRRGGGGEVAERRGGLAAQGEDPAVGVLELRHRAAVQPPGDGEGALERRRIRALGGQEARQVVGDHRVGAVAGIERLVVGDGAGDVAVGLAQAGPGEDEPGIVRRRGDAGVERGLGGRDVALAGEQREERLVRLGHRRGGGDHRAVERLGRGGLAVQGVQARLQVAARHAVGIGGEHAVEIGPGGGRVAGGELGAHQIRHRLGVVAAAGEVLEHGDRRPRAGPRRRAAPCRARSPSRWRPGRPPRAGSPPPGRRGPSRGAPDGCGRACSGGRGPGARGAARRRRRPRPGRGGPPASGSWRSAATPPRRGSRPRRRAPAARPSARGRPRARGRRP